MCVLCDPIRALCPVGRTNFGKTAPTRCILSKGLPEDEVVARDSDDFQ